MSAKSFIDIFNSLMEPLVKLKMHDIESLYFYSRKLAENKISTFLSSNMAEIAQLRKR